MGGKKQKSYLKKFDRTKIRKGNGQKQLVCWSSIIVHSVSAAWQQLANLLRFYKGGQSASVKNMHSIALLSIGSPLFSYCY